MFRILERLDCRYEGVLAPGEANTTLAVVSNGAEEIVNLSTPGPDGMMTMQTLDQHGRRSVVTLSIGDLDRLVAMVKNTWVERRL